jgi:uncharacterized coiled-coil protein SlyX
MSTGDWFTLRPLTFNYDELNQRITQVETQLTNLQQESTYIMGILDQTWDQLTQINLSLMTLNNRVGSLEGTVSNFTTQIQGLSQQIQQLDGRITELDNRVDPLFGRVFNLESLYNKIDEYTLTNYPFRVAGSTYYGTFTASWYRPIVLKDGGGSDLKFMIMVVRAFSIDFAGSNLLFAYCDPINYPIPFVNNNDFKVQYVFNSPMLTEQGHYEFVFYSPTQFQLVAKCRSLSHPGSIINDSFFFLINYI